MRSYLNTFLHAFFAAAHSIPGGMLATKPRFAVAANEAIRLADIQAGEERYYTLGDVFAKYKEWQVAVSEVAEQRYEQVDKQRRQDAHYAAMSSYHRQKSW